uniref:ORF59 n=1 Tax=Steinernema glaseri TaxID=37863 RepID=A0A1I7YPK3_9BILA
MPAIAYTDSSSVAIDIEGDDFKLTVPHITDLDESSDRQNDPPSSERSGKPTRRCVYVILVLSTIALLVSCSILMLNMTQIFA